MTRSRSVAVVAPLVALSLLLVACGDGDGDTGSTEPGTAAPGDGPNATVAPDLPSELDGEVGPVEVIGESLPDLGGVPIADDPALGSPAPVLVGRNFDGETVRIDAATNGPTMIVFLAHWCSHCNAEVPRLNQLRDEGRFPAGLDIVAVSTAANPGQPNFPPSEWIGDVDWTYPVMADGYELPEGSPIAADAYGVDGFPFVALVGSDGKVAARWSGERDPDEVIEIVGERLELS